MGWARGDEPREPIGGVERKEVEPKKLVRGAEGPIREGGAERSEGADPRGRSEGADPRGRKSVG